MHILYICLYIGIYIWHSLSKIVITWRRPLLAETCSYFLLLNTIINPYYHSCVFMIDIYLTISDCLTGRAIWRSNPSRDKRVFSKLPTPKLGPTNILFSAHQRSFPAGKAAGAGSRLLSSGEVKNEWRYTYFPPIRLHGADRDNSAFSNKNSWYLITLHFHIVPAIIEEFITFWLRFCTSR